MCVCVCVKISISSKSITSDLLWPTSPYYGHGSNHCRLSYAACLQRLFYCYTMKSLLHFPKLSQQLFDKSPLGSRHCCQALPCTRHHLQGQDLCSLSKILPNSPGHVAIVRMQEADSSSNDFLEHLPVVIERLKFLPISVKQFL